MNPVVLELLSAIAGHVARTEEARLLVRMASAALMADGVAPTIPTPGADEERRAYERDRKARQRRDRAGHVPECPAVVPASVPVVPGTLALSLSDRSSEKSLEKEETERESTRESGTVPVVPVRVPALVSRDSERLVSPGDELPDELRAAASIVGVRDIDGAWLKFCGFCAGRTIHVAGRWQKWCADERKREQTPAPGPKGIRGVQPAGAGGKSLWKVGEGART